MIDFGGWYFKLIHIVRRKANIFLFNGLIHLICRLKGVRLGENVIFNGFPIIDRTPDSRISFGNNCKFNSSRRSVAMNLTRPCNFVTLNKNAEILIGENTGATGVTITAGSKISIGSNVLIGAYCTIIDNDFHDSDPNRRDNLEIPAKPVVIEDNVFLGLNSLVLKGVTIGKNSVIAANSVVVTSIPPDSFAMGNPCKLVMKRNWIGSSEEA
jgi:acetyltransferase-like isoleucine patch superfamily enzyme